MVIAEVKITPTVMLENIIVEITGKPVHYFGIRSEEYPDKLTLLLAIPSHFSCLYAQLDFSHGMPISIKDYLTELTTAKPDDNIITNGQLSERFSAETETYYDLFGKFLDYSVFKQIDSTKIAEQSGVDTPSAYLCSLSAPTEHKVSEVKFYTVERGQFIDFVLKHEREHKLAICHFTHMAGFYLSFNPNPMLDDGNQYARIEPSSIHIRNKIPQIRDSIPLVSYQAPDDSNQIKEFLELMDSINDVVFKHITSFNDQLR